MKLLHPTYFPNIASFSVLLSDDITWEAFDNYQKQTFRNRTHICTDRGLHVLSIPIAHTKDDSGRQSYQNVKVDNTYPWQRQHWRTLETAYRTSPFFEYYEDDIRPLYEANQEFLMDFNLKTIATVCQCLQVEISAHRTKEYIREPKDMLDFRFLANAKKVLDFKTPEYVQVFGDRHGFIPNLSILDLLFNLGPESIAYLKNLVLKPSHA